MIERHPGVIVHHDQIVWKCCCRIGGLLVLSSWMIFLLIHKWPNVVHKGINGAFLCTHPTGWICFLFEPSESSIGGSYFGPNGVVFLLFGLQLCAMVHNEPNMVHGESRVTILFRINGFIDSHKVSHSGMTTHGGSLRVLKRLLQIGSDA